MMMNEEEEEEERERRRRKLEVRTELVFVVFISRFFLDDSVVLLFSLSSLSSF